MESYFEIEEREDGLWLLEKELATKDEKKLEDNSKEELSQQIVEAEEKLDRLRFIEKAFTVHEGRKEEVQEHPEEGSLEEVVQEETIEE